MNLFVLLMRRILFFLILIPILVLANPLTNHQYSIGLDLGLVKPTNIAKSTSFPLGYSTYSYSSNTNNIDAIIFGVSLNKIIPIDSLNTLQVGVSAHYISDMDVKGNLEQGIAPPYYQSTYSYRINSYQYLVDAKLFREFYARYFPYIYVGVGVSSNRAYNFATAVPTYLTVTPDYRNQTTNSFAYSLGLGLDYFVTDTLSVGFGYRFINLGKVGLGSGMIRNTNVGAQLTQSNLYLNTLLVQLNYFIS